MKLTLFASVVALSLLSSTALPKESLLTNLMHSVGGGHVVPADGTLEVAVSPKAGATELVVKVIASAKKSGLFLHLETDSPGADRGT